MSRARIVNAVVCLYLWLSDALQPKVTDGDFWAEQVRQLFRPNSHITDLPRLLGNAVIPFLVWLAVDWHLRRKAKRRNMAPPGNVVLAEPDIHET
jgi:hypothetical protein